MKIAYILDEDISINSGVVQKIMTKTDIWKQKDNDVKVISLRSSGIHSFIPGGHIVSVREEVGLYLKFIRHKNNIKELDRVLKEYSPDLIYCRHIKYSPHLVKSFCRASKYVVEVNTNDSKEFMLINPRVGIYNKLTRHFLYKSCSGLVTVTNELASDPSFSRFKKPTITVANGVLGGHSKRAKKSPDDRYTLGFIGTPGQPWHGIDKVIFLAKNYIEFQFYIIGPTAEDLIRDQNTASIPDNVELFGFLEKEKAMVLLEQCDVGISTLAIDRAGLTEGAPLKTREYLLMGLPVIIGYQDTDLSEKNPYVLNVGLGENNIINNLDKIHSFVLSSRALNPESIISYASKRFNSEEKESRRLEFLKMIVDNE